MEVTDVTAEQCQQRNIHNRTMDDIAMAAEQWQATPPTYPLLDLGSLLGGNKKKGKQVSMLLRVYKAVYTRNDCIYALDLDFHMIS